MKRTANRSPNELRQTIIKPHFIKYPEGSVLITMGNTQVICNASVEDTVPAWLKNSGKGWVSAEYGMLPRATHDRTARESKKGPSGRTQEISRLIGRALRASVDLTKLDERQITIDCDVIQADGGTRCASITGGYVALALAVQKMLAEMKLTHNPLLAPVVAVSCGIKAGTPLLDLDYEEDSSADVDMNFILTGEDELKFVEVQGTAEHHPFSFEELVAMKELAMHGAKELLMLQKKVLK